MRTDAVWSMVLCAGIALFSGCRANVEEPRLAEPWSAVDAAHPLSRSECIDLALANAPTAAAWKARLDTARANVDQARLRANPTLSLGFEDFGLNAKAAHSVVQTTASLAVALEDIFARKRRSRASEYELAAEEADLRAEANRLAADVARAYDELVAARARIEVVQQLLSVAAAQRSAVEKFVQAGMSARFQLERADLELIAARAELEKARASARALEIQFEFALGFEQPLELQLSDSLTAKTRTQTRDLTELLSLAAEMRPEIAAASARYQAQLERAQLASDRIQFLPTLSAGPRVQGGELRGVAGLDVVLPVFDSGAAAERAQQAALLGAAARLRRTAQSTAGEVCAASERLASAESFLSGTAHAAALRRTAVREGLEKLFAAGEVEYGEMLIARRDEFEARLALLDAEVDAARARIDFDAVLGRSAPPVGRAPAGD